MSNFLYPGYAKSFFMTLSGHGVHALFQVEFFLDECLHVCVPGFLGLVSSVGAITTGDQFGWGLYCASLFHLKYFYGSSFLCFSE